MARKTASKDKKMKMKFKHESSVTTVASSKLYPMTIQEERETITSDTKTEPYSNEEHSRLHGKDDECNCYLRKANLFLPSSLAPVYDLSSGTGNNSKA